MHHGGLVGHEGGLNAHGEIGQDSGHRVFNVFLELQYVAALAHVDSEADGVLSVAAEMRRGRIGVAVGHRGHVAEPDFLGSRVKSNVGDIRFRMEPAGGFNGDFIAVRVHCAGRRQGVLLLDGGNDSVLGDPELCEAVRRELHVIFFVLFADGRDLADVLETQELFADFFHIVLEFPVRESVSREGVNDAIRVPELIIEVGADCFGRECVGDVPDFFSDLVPALRHFGLGCAGQKVDENCRFAGCGIAFQIVEVRGFLEFLLNAVRELAHGFVNGGAGEVGAHDHGPDRKGRIFVLPEREVRMHARQGHEEHEKVHERAVAYGPRGKINLRHWPLPSLSALQEEPGHPQSRRGLLSRGRFSRTRCLSCTGRCLWHGRKLCCPAL